MIEQVINTDILNEPKSRTLPYQDQIIFSKKSEQERGKSEGSSKASLKVSDPFYL